MGGFEGIVEGLAAVGAEDGGFACHEAWYLLSHGHSCEGIYSFHFDTPCQMMLSPELKTPK